MDAEEFEASGFYLVKPTITKATIDSTGITTVEFKVETKAATPAPVKDVKAASANIAKLQSKGTGEVTNKWVPYIYRQEKVPTDGYPKPKDTTADQGTSESSTSTTKPGTLTNNGDGTYKYVFGNSVQGVTTPGGVAVAYDGAKTHRVSIMLGGDAGPTGTATFDFVPNGGTVTETRNIVKTETCMSCHGTEFHGHGGNRRTVENCVTCHNPSTTDANSGNTVDMAQMIHKIHAGGELPSVHGPDGKVWDDPNTSTNEQADNGEYAIWGYKNTKYTWWKVGFPAVLANCQKCHNGDGQDVDNWKTKPNRAACGSCHDTINWTTGTNHGGGAQADDSGCALCHPATGTGVGKSITSAHDWMENWKTNDLRNVPEFTVDLSLSAPANGTHYVAGEAPLVTIVLKDITTGQPIDHTTVIQGPAEGCTPTVCPKGDGKFATSSFFVHGPRAFRSPVLTTVARVRVASATTGPWDLTTATKLDLVVDGGQAILLPKQVQPVSGNISVTVPTALKKAGVTAQEIADWLNANTAFKARAIAYLEGGKVLIRSRNLGDFDSLQLLAGDVTTTVFGGDTAVKVIGGFYPSNMLAAPTTGTGDPKVTRLTDKITYQLDPVDDLEPGTYVVSVEITDRGRKSADDYKTPTVGKKTFQVKQATEEKPPAENCSACHQHEGKGFILDFSRHYKIFDANAVDTCGACHDKQSMAATGQWSGGMDISRRVHAVHFGAFLNYPLPTVGYSNGDPVAGRFWDIKLPQDARYCDQTCHTDKSSGTWATKASRMPCWGCHDSDAAQSHFKIMTYDPTPANPWSGDEEESCQTCH